MINDIVNTIAQNLVSVNSNWLSQIRTLGYLNKSSDSETIVYDQEVKEIGLSDTMGNSGYIRFGSDSNFKIEKIQSKVSPFAYRYTYALRLVVVLKTKYPADINYLLTLHLNHLVFTECKYDTGTASNVVVQAVTGGSNPIANTLQESGKKIDNTNYKVLYIDFLVKFDDNNICDFTQKIILPMDCGCTNKLDVGCYGSCVTIDLPIVADYTGDATIETEFNGNQVIIPIEVINGEAISFRTEHLNADYMFDLKVFDAEGEQITYQEDPSGTIYDCFTIKVIP